MQFAIKCLIGMAVFASPCAYDTDPREPTTVAAMVAKLPPDGSSADIHVSDRYPAIVR